jgi:hypothetical protein
LKFLPAGATAMLALTLCELGHSEDLTPAARAQTAASVTQEAMDPVGNSVASQQNLAVVLESTNKDKRVGARVGGAVGDDLLVDARLNVPFNETATEFELATLDRLANQSNLDIGGSYRFWNPTANDDDRDAVCKQQWQRDADARFDNWACVEGNLSAAAKPCWNGGKQSDGTQCPARADLCKEDFKKAKRAFLSKKTEDDECASYMITAPDLRMAYDRAVDYGVPFFVGGRLKVARKKFHFVNEQFLEQAPETHVSWAATAHAGAYLTAVGYLAAGFRYEHSWKADDSAEYCHPVGTPGISKCQDLQSSPPTDKTKHVFSLEWRRYFGGHVGVAVTLAYDAKNDVFAAELPLYFVQSMDGGLNGGIKLGRSSDDDDPVLSLFVGSTFQLTP